MDTGIGLGLLFGFLFGIILIAYEDNYPFRFFRNLKCRIGKHTFRVGFKLRRNKYFCQNCKEPRKHPDLKVIDGGNKFDINHKL